MERGKSGVAAAFPPQSKTLRVDSNLSGTMCHHEKVNPTLNPDAYVESLGGWQRATVQGLRAAVVASAKLEEVVKWGHLVYLSNGPVLLIRAEEHRVLFGFWRGKRLREIEGRLKPGGKYEMATVELREKEEVSAAVVRRLVKTAVQLNETLGNPTDI